MADTLRYLALAAYALVVLLAAWSVWDYMRAWPTMPRRADRVDPGHIWLIGISYLTLATALAAEIARRLGDPDLTWRTPAGLAAYVVGIAAFLVLARDRQRRRHP